MKTLAVAAIVCVFAFGCDRRPAGKVEGRPGVEVHAPGVHVDAGGGKGVEVQAPGVEVKTPPPK